MAEVFPLKTVSSVASAVLVPAFNIVIVIILMWIMA